MFRRSSSSLPEPQEPPLRQVTDIVSKQVRSQMMSGIKSKDTRLELLLRRGLHHHGFRFRIHDKRLPGCPDIVLPKHAAIIQANGCFWHGHDCSLFKMPSSNRDKWVKKIEGNRQRDSRNREALVGSGWRILDVWECSLKGPDKRSIDEVVDLVCDWVRSGSETADIRGIHR